MAKLRKNRSPSYTCTCAFLYKYTTVDQEFLVKIVDQTTMDNVSSFKSYKPQTGVGLLRPYA